MTTLGEEIFYFYQPEEDLKLEDIVPDLDVPTPDEETERKEKWRCVDSALAKMPRDWRRALLPSQIDGLAGAELAAAIGKPEPQRIPGTGAELSSPKAHRGGMQPQGGDN